jgi:hypothetical protein
LIKQKTMKTKYFNRYPLSKERKEKLLFVLKSKEILFKTLTDYFRNEKSIERLSNAKIQSLVEKSDSPSNIVVETTINIRLVLVLFTHASLEKAQDIVDDMIESISDQLELVSDYNDRMHIIEELGELYRPVFKVAMAKSNAAPTFKRLDGTVALKPVFNERFDYDEMDIKAYEPNLIGKVACISLQLKNSDDKIFYVQFDSKEYEQFLNELIALQIELKILENECN